MKCIGADQLSQELDLDEDLLYKELLEVVKEESEKSPERHFLIDEEKKGVCIVDDGDLSVIRDGLSEGISFIALADRFEVDFETLNWLLDSLYEKKAIDDTTIKYYNEVKEKPNFKVYFEPEQVSQGEEAALVIEIMTETEIDQPKITVDLPREVEMSFEATLPEKITPGRRIDKFHLSGIRYGAHKIEVKFEGVIQGLKYSEDLEAPTFIVKSLPPELSIEKIPRAAKVSALFNQEFELKFRIVNKGRGEAQNVKILGLEEHDDIRALTGMGVGIVPVRGRIDHPLRLRPRKSGEIAFDNLVLYYEDGDGNKFSEKTQTFLLEVSTPKPELKVDLDTIPMISSQEIFPLTLRIKNIGRGEARNIRFRIAIDPPEARLQGSIEYSRRNLGIQMSDELLFQLQAPEEGEVTFEKMEISYNDEEGKSLSYESPAFTIPVRRITKPPPVVTEWPFKIGDLIKKYQILEEIGEGGFSNVYLVEDTVMKQKKALKALRKSLVDDPRIVEDFIEEARKTINLRSPNNVIVYDADKAEYRGQAYPYIVMEYLPRGTLQDELIPGQPMHLMKAFLPMSNICEALIYAHQQNIIHCDIKPSNIFFDEEQVKWKLGDFGMAKIIHGRGVVPLGGAVGYMAPEALDSPPIVTKKSDVYSLGVVFREMLTGYTNGDLNLIREKNRNIAQSILNQLINVIERMTNRDPQYRPELNEVIKVLRLSMTMPTR